MPQAEARTRVTVPVDLGIGPAAYLINNPIFLDQPVHFGLKISLKAIINRALLRRYRHRVPSQYRRYLRNTEEVRLNPLFFLPDSLIISPKIWNTQMYGITFRPLGFGLSTNVGPLRLSAGAGLLLTYVFIESNKLPNDPVTMHFLRLGADVKVELEFPITDSFLISIGWASQLYIPNRWGEGSSRSVL